MWEKITKKWSKEETIADPDEEIVVEATQNEKTEKPTKKKRQSKQKTDNENTENKQENVEDKKQVNSSENAEKAQPPVEEKVSKKKKTNKKTA